MKAFLKSDVFLSVGLLWLALAAPLRAADPMGGTWGSCLYSNSVNDLVSRFDPGTLEVGDQIKLEPGTPRNLGYFDFEYWGWNATTPGSFAGDVQARVRFYQNNGDPFNSYATPGTMFFDSGWFGGSTNGAFLVPTGPTPGYRQTIYFMAGEDFASGGLLVPDEFTWTVQFMGIGAADTVGVDIYSPPVIGENYPDYWENNGGWKLMTNTVPMDFGARFYAVPEPTSFGISLFGGLGILTLVRWLRRRN
jgi:hypothetical protein